MALREDLRQEVAEIQALRQSDSARRKHDEQFYQEHLRPAMLRAHEYFSEVLANINIVSPKIYARYPLDPTRELDIKLRQAEYKFRSNDGRNPREIDVLCKAILDKPHDFYVETLKRADKHAALLDSCDFYYHRRNHLDEQYNIKGARFILEGPMRVRFRIQAAPQDRCIHIDMQNLEDQPRRHYSYQADKLDEAIFERLANMLLREEKYLIPPDVGTVARDELRRQLDMEQQRREKDLADAYREREIAQQEERDAMLVNRAKRALIKGPKEALALVKRRLAGRNLAPTLDSETAPSRQEP